MSDTVRGIQRVSDEVSNGAEQVASSSNELADGATNQAAVVEELTATVTGVSEQVANNSQVSKGDQRKSGTAWTGADREQRKDAGDGCIYA